MSSPTQRSKAHAEKLGYTVAIVERWNPFAHIRQDLFGFGDLLCVAHGLPVLLIQTTTADNMPARLEKIRANPVHIIWLSTGNRIAVWGWSKRGSRGKRKLWTLKEQEVLP
jgi:hypothetical protein